MAYRYLYDNTNMNIDIINIVGSYLGTRPDWVKFWKDIVISRIMGNHYKASVTEQLNNVINYENHWLHLCDKKLCDSYFSKCDVLEEILHIVPLII